jgi:hypothetical protein
MEDRKIVSESLFGAEVYASREIIPCGEADYAKPYDNFVSLIRDDNKPDKMPVTEKGRHFICAITYNDIETVYYVTSVEQAQCFWDYGRTVECENILWGILCTDKEVK